MRTIKSSKAFKRDFKRIKRGSRYKEIDLLLTTIVNTLANDELLSLKYADHALSNNWKDYRECHLFPDLLLIYQLIDTHTLCLIRLGSHSHLF